MSSAPWSVDRVIRAIRHAFADPIALSVGTIDASASIGVTYPERGDTPLTVLHRADQSMYADKSRHSV